MDQTKMDTIVDMYTNDIPVADICAETGVYPGDVYRIIRMYGMKPSRRDRVRVIQVNGKGERIGINNEIDSELLASVSNGGAGGNGESETATTETETAITLYKQKITRRCSNAVLASEFGMSAARVSHLIKRASILRVPGVGIDSWASIRKTINEWRSAKARGVMDGLGALSPEQLSISLGITVETLFGIIDSEDE